MKTIRDLDYVGDGHPLHRLDMFLPDTDRFDTVIYIHGGGLEVGRRQDMDPAPLLRQNLAVVSVDYRMLPEVAFPAFIEDAAQAVAYVKHDMERRHAGGRLFLWGASAGAYITMMLCLDDRYWQAVGLEKDAVSGYISESSQQFAHYNLLKHRGFDSRIERIDETAPIGFVKEGLDIHPLLMIYYSDDMYCRPEENVLMYKSMKRFLPETAVLDILEIDGAHCSPTDPRDRLDAMVRFMEKIGRS